MSRRCNMSKFKFTSIACYDQQEQEEKGTDEIYFKLFDEGGNNIPYKSNEMKGLDQNEHNPDKGHYNVVYPSEVYDFKGELRVELWEYDRGSNPDEKLQSFSVDANNV